MVTGANWEGERRSHMGCSDHLLHKVTHFPSKEAAASHCPVVTSLRMGSLGACGTGYDGEKTTFRDCLCLSPEGLAAYTYEQD